MVAPARSCFVTVERSVGALIYENEAGMVRMAAESGDPRVGRSAWQTPQGRHARRLGRKSTLFRNSVFFISARTTAMSSVGESHSDNFSADGTGQPFDPHLRGLVW